MRRRCTATAARSDDAADAAVALEPLAGAAASKLFAVGPDRGGVAGGLRAAAFDGLLGLRVRRVEAAVDDTFRDAQPFYLTYGSSRSSAHSPCSSPNVPLVTILVPSQVLNAVLLVPLLFRCSASAGTAT